MTNLIVFLERVKTPIGEMLLVTDEQQQVRALDWQEYEDRLYLLMKRQYRNVAISVQPSSEKSSASEMMHQYFAGDIEIINRIPTASSGTEFQKTVWNELRNIAAANPISYGTLARRIGRPTAIRAVGLANGANPIGIIVPCHRVIGANKSLTGYGGGLHRKEWLLNHERKFIDQ